MTPETDSRSVFNGTFAAKQQQQHQQPIHLLDSPLTIATTSVSPLDEDFSPRPLPERLGRVVSSSSSLSPADESDEENIIMKINLPPRRPMARKNISAGSAQYDQWMMSERQKIDQDRETASTLHELQQLIRLANMDSSDYHTQLLDNSLPVLSEKNENRSATCGSNNPSALMQSQMMQISLAIHRLHSIVANLTQDADSHTDDTQLLQSQLLESQNRTQQVEAAAQKLYRRNQKLKMRTQQDKKILKVLQTQVTHYEKQLETQEFQLVTSQLHHHELQLQLQQKPQIEGCGSSVTSSRGRTDSTFSELCLEDIGMDLPPIDVENNDKEGCEDSPASYEEPNVFERTKPTLCFSASGSETVTDSRGRTWSNGSAATPDTNLHGKDAHVTTKTAEEIPECVSTVVVKEKRPPTLPKTTVQLKAKEARRERIHALPGMMSNLNKTFKMFGSMPSNYTLKMVKPFDMQFVVLEVNINGIAQRAFAVTGFVGFDEGANVKPTLGARLVRMNGEDIDPTWDLDSLNDALFNKNCKKTSSLTFRNENWNSNQTDLLNQAVARNAEGRGKL